MSSVKQWPIYPSRRKPNGKMSQHRERSPGPPAPPQAGETSVKATEEPQVASTATPQALDALLPGRLERQRVRGARSTGLFDVPDGTVMQLVIAISSFSAEEQTAAVRVQRVNGAELQPVFFQVLRIAPEGVGRVVIDGLAGERVEVEVMLSSDRLVPTAAVTQFFPADAGLLVLAYKSPGQFVSV